MTISSKDRLARALAKAQEIQGAADHNAGDRVMLTAYDAQERAHTRNTLLEELRLLGSSMSGRMEALSYLKYQGDIPGIEGDLWFVGTAWGLGTQTTEVSLVTSCPGHRLSMDHFSCPTCRTLQYSTTRGTIRTVGTEDYIRAQQSGPYNGRTDLHREGDGAIVLVGPDGVFRFVFGRMRLHVNLDPLPLLGEFGNTGTEPVGTSTFGFASYSETRGFLRKRRVARTQTLDELAENLDLTQSDHAQYVLDVLSRIRDGLLGRIELASHVVEAERTALDHALAEKKLPSFGRKP